jgi:hypothetical protein
LGLLKYRIYYYEDVCVGALQGHGCGQALIAAAVVSAWLPVLALAIFVDINFFEFIWGY